MNVSVSDEDHKEFLRHGSGDYQSLDVANYERGGSTNFDVHIVSQRARQFDKFAIPLVAAEAPGLKGQCPMHKSWIEALNF